MCHIVNLPFILKSILREKKNYGKPYSSPCRNIIFKKSSERNQNPSQQPCLGRQGKKTKQLNRVDITHESISSIQLVLGNHQAWQVFIQLCPLSSLRQISGEIEDCTNASFLFLKWRCLRRDTQILLGCNLLGMYEFGE